MCCVMPINHTYPDEWGRNILFGRKKSRISVQNVVTIIRLDGIALEEGIGKTV